MFVAEKVLLPLVISLTANPESKVHGANRGAIWGRQDPGGPHVGPMNFAICEHIEAAWPIYMRQWTRPSLVQIMACRLSATNHYLNHCLLLVGTLGTLQWNVNGNLKVFIQGHSNKKSSANRRPSCLGTQCANRDERIPSESRAWISICISRQRYYGM